MRSMVLANFDVIVAKNTLKLTGMFLVSRKYDVIHSQRRDNDRERLVGDLQTEGRL